MKSVYKIASKLMKISSMTLIASWIILVLTLLMSRFGVGNFVPIAMLCGAVCVSVSVISDEIGMRLYHHGRGTWGIITILLVVLALSIFCYGLYNQDTNMSGSSLLSLFVISFIPNIVDFFIERKSATRVYHGSSSYPQDPWDFLGMGTPKTPPPIIIEKGEDLDDEWQQHLGIKVNDDVADENAEEKYTYSQEHDDDNVKEGKI